MGGQDGNANTRTISGVTTKVGKTFVTFTVSKKVGRKTTSYKATAIFDLDPLPTWATGAFVGMAGNAYVRMDVTAGGAISGYRFDAAGKQTFSATGFTEADGFYSATLKGKGVSLGIVVGSSVNDSLGVTQGMAEFAVGGGAFNSPWNLDGAAPVVPDGRGTLALKFAEKGVIACTYTVGRNATSGSTQICALTWNGDDRVWQAHVAVALAAKKDKKGKVLVPALIRSYLLHLPADEAGTVITENITVEEALD